MPTRPLPSNPDLNHLKHQARDLKKAHAARDHEAAQRLREFHPRFVDAPDGTIFGPALSLTDAQLTIAREYGFKSWTRLKAHVEQPELADRLRLPHHDRIEDVEFRRAVELIDTGDASGLREHLNRHPKMVHEHVEFEGGNYFRNPTLLEFIAENPVRHGTLPKNIVEVARTILDAGGDRASMNATLELVSTGRVPRECGVQVALIDLLCDWGADPDGSIEAAAAHGEFEAVEALMLRGAPICLPVAAALGRAEDSRKLLPTADDLDGRKALALACQFGREAVVGLLLEAGVAVNSYGPIHLHSTPLHQAALGGYERVARLLVEHGASTKAQDLLWHGTPADWAAHAGHGALETYLRGFVKDGQK